MNLSDRIISFKKLGKYLNAIDGVEFAELAENARNENSWFTRQSIEASLTGIKKYLVEESLHQWVAGYNLEKTEAKTVAVVMAGNIPFVGFHDFLSVLICGHNILIKPSSRDTVLLNYMIRKLTEIEPRFGNAIVLTDRLKDFDAVIATGSDNSSRYFEYYFNKYPHVIRKNRTSCAVLTGFETNDELTTLGKDVFTFFGLGCRNVSKIYLPVGYDIGKILKAWEKYDDVMMHHKYHNNYDYQKSILLVNRMPFLDSGFVLFQESNRFVSPISVVYYEYYADWESLLKELNENDEKIQCVVGNINQSTVRIGTTQTPELWDYADKIDVIKFLETLR